MNVKTNMGKTFLKFLQRHFPKQHLMHKIFNCNTDKIIYYCKRNMESDISPHIKNKFRIPATNILELEMNIL